MSWICKGCDTENPDTVDVCEVCDAQAPVLSDFDYEVDLIYNTVTFTWKSEHCEKVFLTYGQKQIDVTRLCRYRMKIADIPEGPYSYGLIAENRTTTRNGKSFYGINKNKSENKHLKHILIPDSATQIWAKEFYNCSSLKTVIIPDSVTCIGPSAFQDCSSLQQIVIPESVTSIGF